MTCSTCKHWTPPRDGTRADTTCNPLDPDTWEPMALPFAVRVCQSPKLLKIERPIESCGASVIDASEYYAALLTGPDFGCVNHEGP